MGDSGKHTDQIWNEDSLVQRKFLETYLKNISKGKANRISIFCAGEYGNKLYQELRSKLVFVNSFADNNPEKWGYLFDNLFCLSPEELEEEKERTLVIIATRYPERIMEQLKKKSFPYLITMQELEGFLSKVPSIKWTDSFDKIEYSSNEILLLINEFNQTILDLCKSYEDKIAKIKSSSND